MSIAVFILVVCLLVLADAFALYALWTKISIEIKNVRDSVNDECNYLWKRIKELDTVRSSEEKTSQPNYEPQIRNLYHKVEELNEFNNKQFIDLRAEYMDLRAEYKRMNDRLLNVELDNHYLRTVITSNGLKIKPDEKEDDD